MPEFAIVADDLTGANATGVLLAKQGFRVVTVVDDRRFDLAPGGFDGVILNTASRALPQSEARRRVTQAFRWAAATGARFFGKRVDSTLRGNIGAEIEAGLQVLGEDWVAAVVPSFPGSGRITAGGCLIVSGRPVHRTEAAKDPRAPIATPVVSDVISAQSALRVAQISYTETLRGPKPLGAAARSAVSSGARILVFDAIDQEDLDTVAESLESLGNPVVTVDPGPFTAAFLARRLPRRPTAGRRVMVASASVTQLTRDQLDWIESHSGASLVDIDVRDLVDRSYDEARESRIARAVVDAGADSTIFGYRVARSKDAVLNLELVAGSLGLAPAGVADLILGRLARIAGRALDEFGQGVAGLYVTGGDMMMALCSELGVTAIELKAEVLPLAAYGRLVGGRFSGLPVVTKGGLVGPVDAAQVCVQHLLSEPPTQSLRSETF